VAKEAGKKKTYAYKSFLPDLEQRKQVENVSFYKKVRWIRIREDSIAFCHFWGKGSRSKTFAY
jgi:hypothetical protein